MPTSPLEIILLAFAPVVSFIFSILLRNLYKRIEDLEVLEKTAITEDKVRQILNDRIASLDIEIVNLRNDLRDIKNKIDKIYDFQLNHVLGKGTTT